jgi:hypothetical protein
MTRLGPFAPIIGAAVLALSVRAVEALWTRSRGRLPSEETSLAARVTHALLLTGVASLARGLGSPKH